MVLGKPACKRMKLEHSLTRYTKINSKCVKDLNVNPDTIKFLEENIGKTLFVINCSNIFFLDPFPRVMEIKAKINEWHLIKHKFFYSQGNHKQKDNVWTGRKYLQMM